MKNRAFPRPKLIVTDLDKTALRDDKTISKATIAAFAACRKLGIYTAVATARYRTQTTVISALHPDFSILADGTLIYANRTLLHSGTMDAETTGKILKELLRCGYTEHILLLTLRKSYRYNHADKLTPGTRIPHPVNKLLAVLPSSDEAERIARLCNVSQIGYRGENRYSFFSPSEGKLPAIRCITEKLQITLSDVMAFGDDASDIEMLRQCGIGVAMKNAIPEAQEAADFITDSNEEDGVAVFLRQHILFT